MNKPVNKSGISRSRPVTLGEAMETLVKSLGAPPISVLVEWRSRWPEIVGDELSKRTKPLEIVDGVLHVSCNDSVWASQLKWNEADILTKFRDLFGPDLVRKMVIKRD